MLCNNCKNKSFCKHYDYIINTYSLTISIDHCDNYNNTSNDHTPSVSKVQTLNTGLSQDFNIYPDLKEIVDEQLKPIISNVEPIKVNKITCDRCKNEVFSTDIENCIECGRPICIDCRVNTFDPKTGTTTATCERCWSGQEDPISGEDSKVTFSTEKDDKVWSLTDFEEGLVKKDEPISQEEGVKDDTADRKQVDSTRSNKKSKKK